MDFWVDGVDFWVDGVDFWGGGVDFLGWRGGFLEWIFGVDGGVDRIKYSGFMQCVQRPLQQQLFPNTRRTVCLKKKKTMPGA